MNPAHVGAVASLSLIAGMCGGALATGLHKGATASALAAVAIVAIIAVVILVVT